MIIVGFLAFVAFALVGVLALYLIGRVAFGMLARKRADSEVEGF